MKTYTIKEKILMIISGVLAGCVNGFFGTGAGIILIILLGFICKKNDKIIHATTLVCVMIMCLFNSIIFIVKGCVKYNVLTGCLIGCFLGSILGTICLKKIKNNVLKLIFSSLLIVSGVVMIVL